MYNTRYNRRTTRPGRCSTIAMSFISERAQTSPIRDYKALIYPINENLCV